MRGPSCQLALNIKKTACTCHSTWLEGTKSVEISSFLFTNPEGTEYVYVLGTVCFIIVCEQSWGGGGGGGSNSNHEIEAIRS